MQNEAIDMSALGLVRHHVQECIQHAEFLDGGLNTGICADISYTPKEASENIRAALADALAALDRFDADADDQEASV